MAYSLSATPDEELYTMGPQEAPLTGEAAKNRAFRLDVALGEDSPGMEQLTKDVSSGIEDPYRELLSNREMANRQQAATKLVFDNVVGNPDFTPEDAQAILDPGPAPDKSTIVEEQFMKKAMDAILAANTPEEITKAMEENPMGFDKAYSAYEDIIFKNLITSKWEQKIDAEVSAMGWYDYVPYFAATLTGFASWANLARNKEGGIESSAWSTPGALEERIREIRALPPAEMDQAIASEVASLKVINPLDAQRFVHALGSYTSGDAALDMLDNLASLPIGLGLTGGRRISKSLAEALDIRKAQKASRSPVGGNLPDAGRVLSEADRNALYTAPPATGEGTVTLGGYTRQYKDGKWLDESGPLVTDQAVLSELATIRNALSTKSIDIPTVLSGTGRVGEAAQVALREELAVAMLPKAPDAVQRNFASLLRKTSSLIKPYVSTNVGDNLYARSLDELSDLQRRVAELLVQSGRVNRVSRTPEQIMQQAADIAIEKFKLLHRKASDYIADVRTVLPGDTSLNTGQIAVTFLGPNREAFASREAAEMFARTMGLPGHATVVKSVGGRYAVESYADIGEDGVSSLVLTPENKPRNNTWTVMKNWIAGAKSQTSDFQSVQRGAVTHGETALGIILREVYQPYEALGKRSRKAIDQIMKVNQETETIPGSGHRGAFYNTDAELEQGFLQHLKRLPTQKETEAYFAIRRAQDIDYIYRVFSQYRQKATQGFKSFALRRRIPNNEYGYAHVEGRKVDALPENQPDINVLRISEDGMVKTVNLKREPEELKTLQSLIADGSHTIIQPFQPRAPELLRLGGDRKPIAFVVTEGTFKEAPLRMDKQVNYRPGFHNEYKAEWYVKQPRVLDGRFEGDTTAMGFMTEAETIKYGKRMEEARQLLKAGKIAELQAYLKKNLPFDVPKFKALFDEHLSLDVPFTVVKRNTRSVNSGRKLINGKDFTEEFGNVSTELDDLFNPSAQFGDPFVAERDPLVFSVKELGTEDNPLYELNTAELLSPMLSQTRAMGKLIKSELYNDYQLSSANHWIEEFKSDLLVDGNPVTPDQLRRNPIYYLSRAEFNPKTSPTRAAQGEQLRLAIKQLLGQPSEYAMHLDHFKQKLMSGIYNRFGQEYLDYVPENMIPMIKDPLSFMRAVAFHSKLGLFNPVQFWVQGSQVLNAVAIGGHHAVQTFPASVLMRGLRLTEDPKIIEKYGEIAAKFPGWTKEKFIEAKRTMDASAFDRVGGEYSWRNDFGDPNLYRGTMGQLFLDKGPMFFNAGERAGRLTAWNTAYLEYVNKNPKKVGKLNEYDIGKIRARAQVYVSNMTRDNNSWWQNGITGNFTQFWSYNVRMAELMLGHQLTMGEKARLALAQGFLWGANPVSVGLYAVVQDDPAALESLLPWGEDIKVHAINNGVDIDDHAIGAIQNGMISTVFGMMTGEGWDFGSRYGMSPIKVHETIAKNYRENSPIRALFVSAFGPSGSIINDMMKESGNVARDFYEMATGDGQYASLLPMDIANAFREVGSVNTATKMLAIATGSLSYSQNGNVMSTNEDPAAEMTKAIFGVQDLDESLAFTLMNSQKAEQIDKDALKKYYQRIQVRIVDAMNKGDTALARKWMDTMAALMKTAPFTFGEKMNLLYPDGATATRTIDQHIFRDYPNRVPEERRQKVIEGLQNRIDD